MLKKMHTSRPVVNTQLKLTNRIEINKLLGGVPPMSYTRQFPFRQPQIKKLANFIALEKKERNVYN